MFIDKQNKRKAKHRQIRIVVEEYFFQFFFQEANAVFELRDADIYLQKIYIFLFFVQEVNAVFELGDADRDGEIDLQEFIGVMTTSSPVAYKVLGVLEL